VKIETHFPQARKIGRSKFSHEQNTGFAQRDAEDASGRGEQQAFGQQLANEASVAGAERGTQLKLPAAAERARQEQARDVGTGDQQHRAHRAQQQQQRAFGIAYDLFFQREGAGPRPTF
jgi:hypothetical protein